MAGTALRGVIGAPVTPMTPDNSLDLATLERLVNFQIAHGVDAVAVPLHTGESLNLTTEERKQLAERAIAAAAGRVPVLVHASLPGTDQVIDLARHAEAAGAAAVIAVTPYHWRPSPPALLAHFEAVGRAVGVPLLADNLPSRLGLSRRAGRARHPRRRVARLGRLSARRRALTSPSAAAYRLQSIVGVGPMEGRRLPDARIADAVAHWRPRFLTQGVDPGDYARVTSGIERWEDWLAAWCANGDLHAGLATEAEERGRSITAGHAWVRAALGYHFAKFVWVLDMELHQQATARSVESLRAAHRLLDPTAERVVVPFDGATVVGNLRRPRGARRPPLVLLIPGLDSCKEEFFGFEQVFLDRGLATFSLDGPGQGETGYALPIRYDYEAPVAAVLDHLAGREDIDLGRVGIVGVSLGGYYAPRAAAFEPRIRSVVAVGGGYDLDARFEARPSISRDALIAYSHSSSAEEARARTSKLTLEGVLGRLEQPLLVIFGKKDRLVPWQDAERMAREAPRGELVMYPEGNHVCNNLPYLYRPLAADWTRERLLEAA